MFALRTGCVKLSEDLEGVARSGRLAGLTSYMHNNVQDNTAKKYNNNLQYYESEPLIFSYVPNVSLSYAFL